MPKASERPGNTLPSKVTKPRSRVCDAEGEPCGCSPWYLPGAGRASYLGDPTQGGAQSVENAVPPKKITTPTPL